MAEEEKKEEPKLDEAPAPAESKPAENAPAEEPKKDEAPAAEEKKEDEGDKDVNAKILDALDALNKRLDSFFEKKEEKEEEVKDGCDEKKEEVEVEKKEEVEAGVSDSLPRYTQTLGAIEKGYSLDDAFNKLKGRR
jgi:hypothetical protein